MHRILLLIIFTFLFYPISSIAYDLTDSLSIQGTATAVVQHAYLDNVLNDTGDEVSDTGRGTIVLDVGVNYHPTDND